MIQPPKQSFWKRIAKGAVLFAAGLTGIVNAESGTLMNPVTSENFATTPFSMRARYEHTDAEDTHLNKVTTGISPTSPRYNRGIEFWRSYHYFGEEKGKQVDWDSFGFITPKVKFGDIESSSNIYAQAGEKKGGGIEQIFGLGKLDWYLNAEQDSTKETNRIGTGFEHNYGGTWNFGAGIDKVETPKGDTTYYSGKAVWNIDKNDQTGAGFKLADDDLGTNRIAGMFMRYGDVDWGNRTYALYDWKTDESDFQAVTWQTIFAQNPTFNKLVHGTAFLGRNQGYLLSSEIMKSPVTVIESPPIFERGKKGFAFGGNGYMSRTNGNDWEGYAQADFGYNQGKYGGACVFHKFGIGETENSNGVSGILYLGPFKLEASHERFDDGQDRTWGSITAVIPLGGKQK